MMDTKIKLAKDWSGVKRQINPDEVCFILTHDPCKGGPALIWEKGLDITRMIQQCNYCKQPIPLGVRKILNFVTKLESTM